VGVKERPKKLLLGSNKKCKNAKELQPQTDGSAMERVGKAGTPKIKIKKAD
jgi:hypothetical protein